MLLNILKLDSYI